MPQEISPERRAHLSAQEREALTFWKWTYALQADGFTLAQARRLVFCRVLFLRRRLVP